MFEKGKLMQSKFNQKMIWISWIGSHCNSNWLGRINVMSSPELKLIYTWRNNVKTGVASPRINIQYFEDAFTPSNLYFQTIYSLCLLWRVNDGIYNAAFAFFFARWERSCVELMLIDDNKDGCSMTFRKSMFCNYGQWVINNNVISLDWSICNKCLSIKGHTLHSSVIYNTSNNKSVA